MHDNFKRTLSLIFVSLETKFGNNFFEFMMVSLSIKRFHFSFSSWLWSPVGAAVKDSVCQYTSMLGCRQISLFIIEMLSFITCHISFGKTGRTDYRKPIRKLVSQLETQTMCNFSTGLLGTLYQKKVNKSLIGT